jgi:hypothetical protein
MLRLITVEAMESYRAKFGGGGGEVRARREESVTTGLFRERFA